MLYIDDAEQMAWLKEDLKKTSPQTPILVASTADSLRGCFFEDPPGDSRRRKAGLSRRLRSSGRCR